MASADFIFLSKHVPSDSAATAVSDHTSGEDGRAISLEAHSTPFLGPWPSISIETFHKTVCRNKQLQSIDLQTLPVIIYVILALLLVTLCSSRLPLLGGESRYLRGFLSPSSLLCVRCLNLVGAGDPVGRT